VVSGTRGGVACFAVSSGGFQMSEHSSLTQCALYVLHDFPIRESGTEMPGNEVVDYFFRRNIPTSQWWSAFAMPLLWAGFNCYRETVSACWKPVWHP
jgi:hypothetical protein